jgi:hypothetical protein
VGRQGCNDNQVSILACNGNPLNTKIHSNVSFDPYAIHYGAVAASYHCLEMLGLRFHHPLETYIPNYISLDHSPSASDRKYSTTKTYKQVPAYNNSAHCSASIDIEIDSPRWPERGFHLHTQHPLEITEVLQGHDIPQTGTHGSHCNSDSDLDNLYMYSASYCERWEDMVPDVDKLFQWAVANRLNKIEWLLLGNYKWGEELDTKQKRLRILTSLAHEYSLMVGADCPIGNIQQHGWYIVNVRLPFEEQAKQIRFDSHHTKQGKILSMINYSYCCDMCFRERVDWIFAAGFDFLTTESGLSEFTHPECGLMLDLMNVFASYINGTHGKMAAIKVHCSTKQTCTGEDNKYLDPYSGEAVNFNFLPQFATTQMGVMPHTIQAYAFDDPTAGAYGNANFSYIEEFLVQQSKLGQRTVLYYGETAYWYVYVFINQTQCT